jgi:predicted DNA-binding transcriptional regulator AlpA
MGRSEKKKRSSLGTIAGMMITGGNVNDFIPGPRLRAKLGISAVTLWRWRHDEASDFPPPKVIKGRLYFPLAAINSWLANQPEGR